MTNAVQANEVSSKYIGAILGGHLSIKGNLLGEILKKDRKFSGYYMPETKKFVLIEAVRSQIICFRESYDFAEAFNFGYAPLGELIAEKHGFEYAHTAFLSLDDILEGRYSKFSTPYGLNLYYRGGLTKTDRAKAENGNEITEYLFNLDMKSSLIIDHDLKMVIVNQLQEELEDQ